MTGQAWWPPQPQLPSSRNAPALCIRSHLGCPSLKQFYASVLSIPSASCVHTLCSCSSVSQRGPPSSVCSAICGPASICQHQRYVRSAAQSCTLCDIGYVAMHAGMQHLGTPAPGSVQHPYQCGSAGQPRSIGSESRRAASVLSSRSAKRSTSAESTHPTARCCSCLHSRAVVGSVQHRFHEREELQHAGCISSICCPPPGASAASKPTQQDGMVLGSQKLEEAAPRRRPCLRSQCPPCTSPPPAASWQLPSTRAQMLHAPLPPAQCGALVHCTVLAGAADPRRSSRWVLGLSEHAMHRHECVRN
jgi:hypothetical protein